MIPAHDWIPKLTSNNLFHFILVSGPQGVCPEKFWPLRQIWLVTPAVHWGEEVLSSVFIRLLAQTSSMHLDYWG